MDVLARTQIVMWEGASLWLIEATPAASRTLKQTDQHAHHAIQATITLGGSFRLQTPHAELAADVVAVAADTPHVFEAEGLMAHMFIEPESREGRAISTALFETGTLAAVPLDRLGDLPGQIAACHRTSGKNHAALTELGRAVVARLAGGAGGQGPDGRVLRMIAAARDRLDGPVSLADFVGLSGLSAGRLRHLFVEQTGQPFKTYLLWLRLTKAMEEIAGGASLTGAAHGAGFANSAHFSRTFRRMFGVAPFAIRME